MKNINTLFLSFFVVSSFLFMLIASDDSEGNARDKFDEGDANTKYSFYEGLIAEVGTVQIKSQRMYECNYCKDAAYELKSRCEKILKSIRAANPIGMGGAEFKRYAIEFTQRSLDLADDVINDRDYINSLYQVVEAEDKLVDYSATYARENNIEVRGYIDINKLDD